MPTPNDWYKKGLDRGRDGHTTIGGWSDPKPGEQKEAADRGIQDGLRDRESEKDEKDEKK